MTRACSVLFRRYQTQSPQQYGKEYEGLVQKLLSKARMNLEITGGPGDGGIDLMVR